MLSTLFASCYNFLRYDSKKHAEILSSLRDDGELSLMVMETTTLGLGCHDCGFYSFVSEKLIVSSHEAMTAKTTIHQRWGQLQSHKSLPHPKPPARKEQKIRNFRIFEIC